MNGAITPGRKPAPEFIATQAPVGVIRAADIGAMSDNRATLRAVHITNGRLGNDRSSSRMKDCREEAKDGKLGVNLHPVQQSRNGETPGPVSSFIKSR